MTFTDWVKNCAEVYREFGFRTGTSVSVNELYIGVLRRVGNVWNYGQTPYARDWDVLVLLDACRPDALAEVSDEYDFLPETIPTAHSPGSQSAEWMRETFTDDYRNEVRRTTYVTANPHSRRLDASRFETLDEVWTYGWDSDIGTVPPEIVTDRAISAGRSGADPLIVHYMQPHAPFRGLDVASEHANLQDSPVKRMQRGEIAGDEVWDAYVDTLRWVLDSVEVLLKNLQAEKLVLSADHGEGFGEWWCYGHPEGVPLPPVKTVPWVEVEATDERTHEPTHTPEKTSIDEDDIEKRLENLGYK